MRKAVVTRRAASPVAVYSQGIVADGPFVFVSGQGPLDPVTGKIVPGGFAAQAERTFQNVGEILKAAGSSWAHAVRVGIFLADLGDFDEMNRVYRRFVKPPFPARTTVKAGLPHILIEVDAVAVVPKRRR
jgi:2-iminobutanoate/2-iminopropanoate deaminase